MPTPDLFDGVDGLPDRIGLLVRELSAFFERSEPWWRASQRDPADGGFWADAAARYYTDLDTLVRVALGPRSSDDDAVAVITTLFNAWVLGMLQTTGRTEDEAVELVSRSPDRVARDTAAAGSTRSSLAGARSPENRGAGPTGRLRRDPEERGRSYRTAAPASTRPAP